VTADSTTGEVSEIGLRKTRLEVDGNLQVVANRKVEDRWKQHR